MHYINTIYKGVYNRLYRRLYIRLLLFSFYNLPYPGLYPPCHTLSYYRHKKTGILPVP
nr:MAG TPA: hypothetical protein [Bacteriophage sp.]